jgi:hypothetical protein
VLGTQLELLVQKPGACCSWLQALGRCGLDEQLAQAVNSIASNGGPADAKWRSCA